MVIYSALKAASGGSSPNAPTPQGPRATTASGVGGGTTTATLGKPTTLDGIEVTVIDAKYSTGFEFQKPATGYVYVAYKVRLKAVSDTAFVSSADWTALADGTKQGTSAFVLSDEWEPSLPFAELRQGATTEGWITFEVPKPTTFVRLVYDPNFFSDEAKLTLDTKCCS